jgi:hypothetical protein
MDDNGTGGANPTENNEKTKSFADFFKKDPAADTAESKSNDSFSSFFKKSSTDPAPETTELPADDIIEQPAPEPQPPIKTSPAPAEPINDPILSPKPVPSAPQTIETPPPAPTQKVSAEAIAPTPSEIPFAPENNPVSEETNPEAGATETEEAPDFSKIENQFGSSLDTEQLSNQFQISTKKKKSGKKHVAIIISSIIVLILAALACLFFFVYQRPENIVAGAIRGVIRSPAFAAKGDVTVTSDYFNASANFDYRGRGLVSSASARLSLSQGDNGLSLTLAPSYILDENGDIYIKISGIENVVDLLISLSDQANLSSEDTEIQSLIYDIDDEWLKISLSELGLPDEAVDAYRCVINSYSAMLSDRESQDEIIELFKKYPYLVVSDRANNGKNGYYYIDIDYKNLALFTEAAIGTDSVRDVVSCLGDAAVSSLNSMSGQDFSIIENTYLPDDLQIALKIDYWTHNLTGVKISFSTYGIAFSANIEYTAVDSVSIEPPASFTNIQDLVESYPNLFNISPIAPLNAGSILTTTSLKPSKTH